MLDTRIRFGLIFVAMTLALTGCGRKYHLKTVDMEAGGWACSRGSTVRTGYDASGSFDGQLNLLWAKGTSGKPAGPLAIHYGCLVFPDTKRKIRFYDTETGRHLGRLKAKGIPQTGVVVSDSLAIYGVAPRRNFIRAYNLLTAKRLWQMRIKDVLPGPIIQGNRLYISSAEGELMALELPEGVPAWSVRLDSRATASASLVDDKLYQPGDGGRLYGLDARDGKILFETQLDGPLVSPVAVADRVYAGDVLGQVYALDQNDGAVIWQKQLDGPIWNTPAVTGDRLYVGHSGGKVIALNRVDGELVWSHDLGTVVRASVLVVGDFVVAGSMAGNLVVLRADDGSLVDSTTLKGAIEFPPVTDGRRLFVATQAGKIVCFGEYNEPTNLDHHGVSP
ncbi:MAG: PQQ-binding-like beta-propeller repeat protein [candidate division Zixibacteria bacterium]|nr:PQQ-binding-like beta-propeller repeat protein [candidate division Zixibacteria bacterium]